MPTWRREQGEDGMRSVSSAIPAALALAALAGLGFAATPAPRYVDLPGAKQAGSADVDVELVIAVDVSYSMDPDEQALQREGYVEAISSRDFIDAVRKGPNGRIAVTYVEWASVNEQKVIVPWQVIDGPEAAGAFVQALNAAPIR